MIKNGIYSGVTKKERPVSKILAILFGAIAFLLLAFIVWSTLTFKSGTKDVFVPQASEISELKIKTQEQAQTIDDLRSRIAELEEALEAEKKKLEEYMPTTQEPADDETLQGDESRSDTQKPVDGESTLPIQPLAEN